MLCTPKASRANEDVVVGVSEGEEVREDYHGSDFVIVNGTVIPVSRDGKGGILVINNVNGEVLHHDDGEGNITIFSDPLAGSSTVVPINYNIYEDRPFTGTTASNVSSRGNSGNFDNYLDLPRNGGGSQRNSGVDISVVGNRASSGSFDNPRTGGGINSRRNSGVGLNSRRNSGVGINSRRNSGVELVAELVADSYLDISRRNSREIPAFIPAVLSITSRSRRNSRDSVIEAEARAVQSDNDDDSDDSDDSDDDEEEKNH